MRKGYTFRLLGTQVLLTIMMAGLLNAALPFEHCDYGLQGPAANQAAGSPSQDVSPSKNLAQNQAPQNPRPALTGKLQKVRKWTGSLVDAGCMSSALRREPGSSEEALFADPLSEYWQTVQSSQRTDQEHDSRAWSPQGQPQTPSQTAWSKDSEGEPDASERQLAAQRAQLKLADMLAQTVKACSPSGPTTRFGLVVSGQLLRFDATGDFRAKEAISAGAIEPGKAVKAKVIGVIEAENTVRVASIEIKGSIPAPLVHRASSAGR